MNEFDRAAVMRKEIRSISNYRALLISKYFISISLVISSFFVGYYGYAASPVYILLLFLVLPSILTFAFKDYSTRLENKILKNITKDNPFVLNSLKRKYSYSKVNFVSNSVIFFFILLLILLWQLSLYRIVYVNPIILYQPTMIITSGVMLRIILIIYYQIKLPYDLTHNKL